MLKNVLKLKIVKILSFTVFLFGFIFSASAYYNPGTPQGFINDFTQTLTQEQKQSLEEKLKNFEKNTTNEITVVLIKNLEDDTIENFAVELFKDWGIGKKEKDNGVLMLLALDNREVRIEVGYGLEGTLTDSQSSWIIRNILVPTFRENHFYEGIDKSIDTIIGATEGEYMEGEQTTSNNEIINAMGPFIIFFIIWSFSILARSKSWWAGGIVGGIIGVVIGIIQGFIYMGIIALAIFIPLGLFFDYVVSRTYQNTKTRGGRPPWWIGGSGFGSSGSGFGGFGGGMSGGGGASGRW
ncbi:TPM domain-containing protein [Candidatus Peregrinibacteria bacterium]|nr:TPM domain-containing protein [Candidatus Peregrinibacteria bacterium]